MRLTGYRLQPPGDTFGQRFSISIKIYQIKVKYLLPKCKIAALRNKNRMTIKCHPKSPREINRDVMFASPGNLHVKSCAFPSKRRLACKSIKMKSKSNQQANRSFVCPRANGQIIAAGWKAAHLHPYWR